MGMIVPILQLTLSVVCALLLQSDLLLTSEATNRTARLHFTKYNEEVWDTKVSVHKHVPSMLPLPLPEALCCILCYRRMEPLSQRASSFFSSACFSCMQANTDWYCCRILQGYQFVCATQRSYWVHWDTPVAIQPDTLTLHKMDLMNATAGWLYLSSKWPQVSTRPPPLCSPGR